MVIGCDTIESIVNRIKSGDLTRDNDEKYAGGFMDLAAELADRDVEFSEEKQMEIYYLLWQIVDQFIEIKED